ncbi:MAG: hypothetical protein AMXMBFR25_03830 [Lysobacterales bacterium]
MLVQFCAKGRACGTLSAKARLGVIDIAAKAHGRARARGMERAASAATRYFNMVIDPGKRADSPQECRKIARFRAVQVT